jgi:hypothetical protein
MKTAEEGGGMTNLTDKQVAERLAEAVEAAPKILEEQMKEALAELHKGLPEAHSGEVLSARVTW